MMENNIDMFKGENIISREKKKIQKCFYLVFSH